MIACRDGLIKPFDTAHRNDTTHTKAFFIEDTLLSFLISSKKALDDAKMIKAASSAEDMFVSSRVLAKKGGRETMFRNKTLRLLLTADTGFLLFK